MPHKTRKPNNTRLCRVPSGAATPHAALIESRIVQIVIQNKSTDPKNSGARTNTTIVVQSWMDLNVAAKDSDRIRRIIVLKSRRSVRTYHVVFAAAFTLVTVFAALDTAVVVLLISNSSL